MNDYRSSTKSHRARTRVRLLSLAAAIVASAAGCGPTMDIQVVSRPGLDAPAARAAGCELEFDERQSATPPGCSEIADAWFGDTGFTTNCGWDRVAGEARRKGCELGADIAQVVWNEAPGSGSTCYQIRVRYLACRTAGGGSQ